MQETHLLQLIVIDDVLVGGTALEEGVEPVHVVHVPPQVHHALRYLEVREVLAGHADVLQPRHELAVEAAHGVAGEETRALAAQVLVDLAQMSHQRRRLRVLVLVLRVQQQQLQFLGRQEERKVELLYFPFRYVR